MAPTRRGSRNDISASASSCRMRSATRIARLTSLIELVRVAEGRRIEGLLDASPNAGSALPEWQYLGGAIGQERVGKRSSHGSDARQDLIANRPGVRYDRDTERRVLRMIE